MRKYIFSFSVVLLLASCTKKIGNLQLKDYKSIEGIRIGMPIDDAVKLANKNYFALKSKILGYDDSAQDYEYIVYTNKSKKESLFTFNAGQDKKTMNKVFRIVIKNPKYSTQEGIRVGMSMKELNEKGRLKSADFNNNDGLYIFSDKFDGGYWMYVDMKKYSSYNFDNPKINTLPEGIKIKGIIIF
jgi:hypothetical protein